MNVVLTLPGTRDPSTRKSLVHVMTLALIWLMAASSAVVFSEPAPFDVLMMALIVILPVVGLTRFNLPTITLLAIWLIIGAAGLVSSIFAHEIGIAVKHTTITIYLSIAAVILTGFVAKNVQPHSRLMMNAYLLAAVFACLAAIIGYFNILPGWHELFTLYGRARGTFKDPNVFGAFLIPAIIYCVHICMTKPLRSTPMPTIALVILSMGMLLSFSRGAWAAIAIALAIYIYLIFVTTRRDGARLKLILLCLFGGVSLLLFLAMAVQSDAINGLLLERASFDQSYDQGPEGRFGGQQKSVNLILSNPLGIGALDFGRTYHTEEPHNVYLSMFLNAGWVGGFTYAATILMTIILGFRHAFRHRSTQGIFIVILASFTATALEGWIIDTDHWRHFFLLLAILWGIMIGEYYDAKTHSNARGNYQNPQPRLA